MTQMICRLCLQSTSENFHEVEESLKNILELDLGISKETMMCIDCTSNLQVFFDLKSACANMETRLLPATDFEKDVNIGPANIEYVVLKQGIENKHYVKCGFCAKSTEQEDLISLYESKENMSLINILEKYIPELDPSNFEELLTCETCLDGIQRISTFFTMCLDVEEKIRRYTEIEGVDDKGQINLQDVQQFKFKPIKFEDEFSPINELGVIYDQILDGYTVKAESEVKIEIEVDDGEPIIKIENIDIKLEKNNCDSFKDPPTEIKLDNDPLEMPMYNCELGLNGTKHRESSKQPNSTHKKSVGSTVYKCEICTYESTRRSRYNGHILTHKSPLELQMFKCDLCAFETKTKEGLKLHMFIVHTDSSEVTLYNCEMCTYKTKLKVHLKQHKLVHMCPSELVMFKCDVCLFETKYKSTLKRHILTHRHPLEREVFKCEMCAFESKTGEGFKKHMFVVHPDSLEVTLHNCDMCTYETKFITHLNRHKLSHEYTSETSMFKCDVCPYETKFKFTLRRHVLKHKSPSELEMFKCEMCEFETKRRQGLRQHMLIAHTNTSETTQYYNCEMCKYKTKHKRLLNRHRVAHKSKQASDIVKFKCEICTAETKHKSYLKRHMFLFHQNSPLYKCEYCTFATKYKLYLNKHKLSHKIYKCPA